MQENEKKSPYIDSQFPLQMRFDLMVYLKQKVSLDLKLGSRRWICVFCFSNYRLGEIKNKETREAFWKKGTMNRQDVEDIHSVQTHLLLFRRKGLHGPVAGLFDCSVI